MKEYEITENIKEFILGGNSSFTILQEATSSTPEMQYKYKITTPKGTTMLDTPVWYVKAELSQRSVEVNEEGKTERSCTVIVPQDQLSLAIGNKGQNARLAAKLTGYKIDIKPEV